MIFTPLIALAAYASAAPAGTSVSSFLTATPASASVTPSSASTPTADAYQSGTPEPERGSTGASILGPQNIPLERESPDFMIPPTTDSGSVENVKWPFALSHNRVQDGGWARQQNEHGMPLATTMTGGLNDTAQGCEFLLVLDDGTFSKDSTFLLTDWLVHVPKEVLAKNFRVNASAFDHIPDRQLWMLPSAVPTQSVAEANPVSPAGAIPVPYTFAASKASPTNVTGGTVKVIDSRTFNISQTIAVAEVTVVPGGIRELHAHLELSDETISQLQKDKPVVVGPGEW
ncbi:RmlC-like cupin domain-containing protein [Rhizoctonia solani]|nr:RmlC-like cupin domain-containing protein [Rhizoctonia solani]